VLWPWGFGNVPTGNDAGMVALGRKFAWYNGYTPQQAIELTPTDGTTLDFAYGELGVADYTFELGTAFFQEGDLDGDLNGDGVVNFTDLSMMKDAFFGEPGPAGPVFLARQGSA